MQISQYMYFLWKSKNKIKKEGEAEGEGFVYAPHFREHSCPFQTIKTIHVYENTQFYWVNY